MNTPKNLLTFVIAILFSASLVQAEETKDQTSAKLLSSNVTTSTIRFRVVDFEKKSVMTNWGEAFIITADDATPILEAGAPDLPKLTSSLVIPDMAQMQVEVIATAYTDYPNIEVAPSKGNFTRDINPATVPFVKGAIYQQNAFYPAALAQLRSPYIVRDYRGQTVVVHPFQYNPVTKILRVHHEMIVKVYKVDNNGVNPFIREGEIKKLSSDFKHIYNRHFLNTDAVTSGRYTPVEERGNMLIIAHNSFMNDMQPFIDWKIKKGIPTEMVDVATIGNNATAIAQYVKDYYNNNGLTFLLLVGDAQHVTSHWSNAAAGDSDNMYGYISGNDSYPELLVGRFSCETSAHCQTMVDRVMRYEITPPTTGNWYATGVGIASDEGPGDDGEMDYEHIRNIRDDLVLFNYSAVHELYDGSQGGQDAAGDPTAQMLFNILESGVSIINYTGHGSDNSFGTTGLNSGDVDQLTNVDKYPFLFSVACVNGNFVGGTCFAETWLRAKHNSSGEPTGAIGTFMATINQSWDPPMSGQDEMNDILTELIFNNVKRSYGAIAINGCLQMNDDYGGQGDVMTDTWTCFGDPSVEIRTAEPTTMNVNHSPTIDFGALSTIVSCNVNDAFIGLSQDNQVIGNGIIVNNIVTINFFQPINSMSQITVTATAFNKLPYFGVMDVNPVGIEQPKANFGFTVHPNPFKESAQVNYRLETAANVKLSIYNLLGEQVLTIVDRKQGQGTHTLNIDGSNLGAGVYFTKLTVGAQVITRKLVLNK